MNRSYIDYLHLFVLVAFAIAQPLYDLLGKNPEFFVAHSAKPLLIISLILFLSFGIALVLVSVEFLVCAMNKRAQRVSHIFFVFSLITLILLPLIKKVTLSDMLVVGLSGFGAFFFTVFYTRFQVVRMFITVLLPTTLIFPLWFILGSPVSRLVLPQAKQAHSEIQINNPVPIVFVIFDEFSITALLDSEEQIDSVRFPNFAALASEGIWFPNAITVSESTVKAIPAIVSGLNPKPGDKLTATAKDYPNSLFTMLGGQYEMKVFEVYTQLCPAEICLETYNGSLYERVRLFFSDILVMYTHLIFPPSEAKRLPTLDGRWAGFFVDTLSAGGDALPPAEIQHIRTHQKDEQIKQFLSQIRFNDKPQLYFLHTLLPHIPYSYLASGQKYSIEHKLPDGILSDKDGWLGENTLINTAYHRYLQQVGYVDRFLGKLRENLISEGIYENAMIVVLADHGVAFEPWQPRRVVNDINKSEILKIPLFIKFPKQNQGFIDKRIVTSTDILPTIIDVIQADVSWELDGTSLYRDKGDIRKGFDFVGFGFLSEEDILGFPKLKWQIEYFGERTPLDSIVPKGPLNKLVGRDLWKMQIDEFSDLLLISDNIDHFQYVDLLDHFMPSLFSGYIKGATLKNINLAVAINGKIWLTTKTSQWNEKEHYFSVLLPKVALQLGNNDVRLYLIELKDKTVSLRPINLNRKNLNLEQTFDGNKILVFSDGKKVVVEKIRNNMDGYLDWLTLDTERLVFEGWAADLVDNQPASDILIFRGEKIVWQGASRYKRDGVARAFNQASLSLSGYRMVVPLKAFESISGDVNVIALSGDKRAFKLHIKQEHKELIHKTLK